MLFSRDRTAEPLTVVEAMTVPQDRRAEFLDWDNRYTEALREAPGFISVETLAPNPPEQPEWVSTARWASREDAERFAETEAYRRLEAEGDQFVGRASTMQFYEGGTADEAAVGRKITSLLYWTVPDDQAKGFASWHEKYAQAMAESTGFQGYQLQEPIEGLQDDWVESVLWDSPRARDNWVRSEARQRMLELGEPYFTTFRARNVATSFEGWFRFDSSTQGSPVPTWKQSMVVLLILYPTVFLLNVYVTNPLEWEMWAGLFLGNVLSVALMGFLITPLVMKYVLGWWLNPPPTADPAREWRGVVLVVALYVVFIVIFSMWPASWMP